jgi:uroporphyrinogen-III decarboxylase
MTREEKLAAKTKRIETAISLQEPDCVPFAPMTNGFPMLGYGINTYDAMMDFRNIIPGIQAYIRDYDPDGVFVAGLHGIKTLEALGTGFIKWPGPTCGLPLNVPFQHTDGTYLLDDELHEFILDPTHTMLTKILPRKHKSLNGLGKLYFRETFDNCFLSDLTILADPDVQESVNALMQAGKYQKERVGQLRDVLGAVAAEGVPLLAQGAMCTPFDAYADSVRGIIRAVEDISEFPDELEEILKIISEMNVDRIMDLYKTRGVKRVFVPLHCGVDEFMSPAAYERFYWPGLKKTIDSAVERGMELWIFCEGKYNTRLEVISDVPKGKVTYCFEKIDIRRAKETVGKAACICGTLPTTLLCYGTPGEVERATKEQIDVLAPGGGFIMNCSMIIDQAKHENMRIWRDTTEEYGRY